MSGEEGDRCETSYRQILTQQITFWIECCQMSTMILILNSLLLLMMSQLLLLARC